MHKSSYDKMSSFRDEFLADGENLHIMDLGSQDVNGSYKDLFQIPGWTYTGVDMAKGDNVDIVLASPYHWKEIPARSIDVVVSGQAFEHIRYFWVTVLEIFRVLKPGGMCVLIAPSSGSEHRYPVDCWRFYPDGLSAMATYAQLDVVKSSTQWHDMNYKDGSDQWHDSMLICQKPDFPFWISVKSRIKNRIQHTVMNYWLPAHDE